MLAVHDAVWSDGQHALQKVSWPLYNIVHSRYDNASARGITMKRRTFAAALVVGMGALSACASTPPALEASQIAPLNAGYLLAAGDRVRIIVFNETSLTGEYSVTPQGTIAFPLIGTIQADGKTTEDVSQFVREKLKQGYVLDPRVSVEVISYRPYYILGEVNKPGEYSFSNGLTVQQAVAAAGGFSYRANRGKVFLRRRAGEERTVDLNGPAVQVLPGDTIRVGERYL
ncbi:polysaccharide export protein [Sphingomonas sp. TDK1]|uniref:polysaccharide export protein n=1 Tax=Sphingomonas sp. TDK1 TaxID=453247 RepID=UPI001E5F7CB1|nr:polysaccharide biosynthesis/export family protein [Sphingomonas sp. TDK1]